MKKKCNLLFFDEKTNKVYAFTESMLNDNRPGETLMVAAKCLWFVWWQVVLYWLDKLTGKKVAE